MCVLYAILYRFNFIIVKEHNKIFTIEGDSGFHRFEGQDFGGSPHNSSRHPIQPLTFTQKGRVSNKKW